MKNKQKGEETMENEKKVLKSFKIEESVWQEFKKGSPNVSEGIRQLIKQNSTSKKRKVLANLYYCTVCKKHIQPDEALGFHTSYDEAVPKEERRAMKLVACSSCVERIAKEGCPKINEDTDTEAEIDRKLTEFYVKLSYDDGTLMKPEALNAFFELAVYENFMFWDFFKGGFETPTTAQMNKTRDDRAKQSEQEQDEDIKNEM